MCHLDLCVTLNVIFEVLEPVTFFSYYAQYVPILFPGCDNISMNTLIMILEKPQIRLIEEQPSMK